MRWPCVHVTLYSISLPSIPLLCAKQVMIFFSKMDAIKMPSGFGELLVAICFLYLGYFSGLLFYRLTVHPLSRFPGPKLAAASSLYELLYDVILSRGRGRLYYEKIEEMHDLYGRPRVIRY